MGNARHNILARLRKSTTDTATPESDFSIIDARKWTDSDRIMHFRNNMKLVQTEVHTTSTSEWTNLLQRLVQAKGINTLLFAPETEVGVAVKKKWEEIDQTILAKLVAYTRDVEGWKEELFFNVDASITSARSGIADTGTLILWPTLEEPRLMSLVPSIHFVVLKARRIHDTFTQAINAEKWVKEGLPSNVLLISGPSKTSDIEQTLAYGVHGPKEVIVFLLE
jgi:L-lactate dehydrogenase complex protein LldG